jgi:hypothetical protein
MVVVEITHQRMAGQKRADGLFEHSASFAVNQANLAEAFFPGGLEVAFDDVADFAGEEGVKIEKVFDRKLDRLVAERR